MVHRRFGAEKEEKSTHSNQLFSLAARRTSNQFSLAATSSSPQSMAARLNGFHKPSPAELAEREARQERRDKISKLMGEYLLKGYKMLNEYCDECTNILLESRQGVKYCVACEEVDVVQPVANTTAPVAPRATTTTAPTTTTAVAPVIRTLTAEQLERVMNMREGEDVNEILNIPPPPAPNPIAPEVDSAPPPTEENHGAAVHIVMEPVVEPPQHQEADPNYAPPPYMPHNPHRHVAPVMPQQHVCGAQRYAQTITSARNVLVNKLDWATRALHAEQNLTKCRQLVEFIGECGKALKMIN